MKYINRQPHIRRSEYALSAESIDSISDSVQAHLAELKYEVANIARIRLTVEEVLLVWREHFGDEAICALVTGRRFRKHYLCIEAIGPALNPFEESDAIWGDLGQNLLKQLGLKPEYSYSEKTQTNSLCFDLRAPRLNPAVQILFAIALAVICGLMGFALPDGLVSTGAAEILPRISEAFFRLLGMISGPLVFLSVLVGICSIGDTATLSGVGKRIISMFAGISLAAAIIGGACYVLLFHMPLITGAGSGGSGLMEIVDMLFDMIPENIVNPFQLNSSLQIIVIAALFGMAMLVLGKRTAGLYSVIEQLQLVAQTIMNWIGAMLPAAIFVVILQNIWSDSIRQLVQVWQPFVFTIALMAVLTLAMLVITALKLRKNPFELFRSISSSFIIALTTASSSACFGEIFNSCRKLGVKKKISDFGVPLGLVLCAPGSVIGFLTCVLYSAQAYGVEVSAITLLIAIISSTFLVIASPPIPGGVMSCYTVLFVQLGIPLEGLGVVMTLSVFLDFFCTAVNVCIIQLMLASQARRLQN